MADHLKYLIPKLAGQRLIVLGDVMLDEYVTGRATRLSREAPVPVLEFESRQWIPGGAANPAANIVALGSYVLQIGVIGEDAEAAALRQVLRARGIDTTALIPDIGRPTTVKTRIMAQMGLRFPQQLARLDRLSREPISALIEQKVCALLANHLPNVDALLLSDYHVGLLTPSLVTEARRLAGEHGVSLTADAQGQLDKYRGFTLVKCNADEARDYLRRDIFSDDAFAAAALELCQRLELKGAMVITRGPDGATVADCDKAVAHIPAPAIADVYDTVGAGDTTIAVLTLAIGAGATYFEATTLANYASGLVVRHVGNYTPSPDELARALESESDYDH
ncbi:MAG: ribokinase [Burkholderiales bacterium]|nr:ribokinase [Anaerolineae bacterium]